MTREIKILFNFTGYLLLGILICLIGLSNVFAATYTPVNYKAQLYDNINGSLSSVTTDLENNDFYYGFIGLTAYTSGGAWGVSSPIPLIANHTYSMTVDPYVPGCGFTILSTVNRIGVGTSLSNAKISYENNTNVTEKFSQAISNSRYLQYVFTPTINASYIVFPYSTTSTCSSTENQLSNIVIEDLGESSISQNQINISLNNQTNEINNFINNSTDTITGAITDTENNINSNIDDMEQSIIESNKETQETIKDQFNDCRDSYNLIDFPESLTFTGTKAYTAVLSPGTYTLSASSINSSSNNHLFLFYLEEGNKYVYLSNSSLSSTFTISKTSSRVVIYSADTSGNSSSTTTTFNKLMLNEGSSAKPYEPYGEEICSNRIDETNNQLGDLNNNITNDNIDNNNVSNAFSEFENFVDENATISSLLTLPVTLFSAILNGMQNSCVPFNLGSLYGEDLILPCINISSYLGNTLWTMIDIIISGFAIYFISQKFIKVFNNFSSMKEGDVIDD